MALTREDVLHVARLARLALTEEEVERMRQELSRILAYIDQLQEVDTSHVPPTAHVLDVAPPLREDAPRPGLPREKVLANAAERTDEFFVVPPVLEE